MSVKLSIVLFLLSLTLYGQTNEEIAGVYFKKAQKAIEAIDYKLAKANFDKGVSKLDTISNANIAELGTFIYYELKGFQKAKYYAKQFFTLFKNKSTDRYDQMLELYVEIEEEVLKKEEEEKKLLEEKLRKEKELRRIDSLKNVWKKKEEKFTLYLDTIFSFNSYGVALYKKDGWLGVIDDNGERLVEEKNYKDAVFFEGYLLLKNKVKEPSKIKVLKLQTKEDFLLPKPSVFFDDIDNYGVVTMPRGNGNLVMYMGKVLKTLIYDLEERKKIKADDIEGYLKKLKKNDKIDRFDDEDGKWSVKINKEWYVLGEALGGGVYSLYKEKEKNENESFFGYMFTENKEEKAKLLAVSQTGFLSSFYKRALRSFGREEGDIWYSEKGKEKKYEEENEGYKGKTKIKRLDKKRYQLIKEGKVFIKEKTLEKIEDFLKRNK
ncbi:conserved exported hypothetical protein [Tenacibaculum sp. 190524A02b]|uniref:WG repeat protein n=1 Tax=Tenacibaculum vairaonense TaxID=3137860 RepID=A0ABP1F5P4_9FLAO